MELKDYVVIGVVGVAAYAGMLYLSSTAITKGISEISSKIPSLDKIQMPEIKIPDIVIPKQDAPTFKFEFGDLLKIGETIKTPQDIVLQAGKLSVETLLKPHEEKKAIIESIFSLKKNESVDKNSSSKVVDVGLVHPAPDIRNVTEDRKASFEGWIGDKIKTNRQKSDPGYSNAGSTSKTKTTKIGDRTYKVVSEHKAKIGRVRIIE